MTQADWCRKHDYHRSHLYLTLKDEKQSLKLAAMIDAFIQEVEEKAKSVAA
jgi:alpha-D-ribose 1-methylphosphonate 5-triphosphate synthase subunit PhnG